ncbi:MAG: hypothetical protein LC122_12240 [Chitinophagales bacterium]|nr:hypothetical protein [Chitinophagales bacterium]
MEDLHEINCKIVKYENKLIKLKELKKVKENKIQACLDENIIELLQNSEWNAYVDDASDDDGNIIIKDTGLSLSLIYSDNNKHIFNYIKSFNQTTYYSYKKNISNIDFNVYINSPSITVHCFMDYVDAQTFFKLIKPKIMNKELEEDIHTRITFMCEQINFLSIILENLVETKND